MCAKSVSALLWGVMGLCSLVFVVSDKSVKSFAVSYQLICYLFCFIYCHYCYSVYYVLYRIKTPRKEGGLGEIQIPLLSDVTKQISKDYGVLLESEGHALR